MDLKNRLEGATPLHLAVKLENEAARQGVVEMLLDAGADPRFVLVSLPQLLCMHVELIGRVRVGSRTRADVSRQSTSMSNRARRTRRSSGRSRSRRRS